MRKASQAVNKVFQPPSQMHWTDEKLASLSQEQLVTLFENLQTQREAGRVSAQAAEDLARLITERLPANALRPRRKRPRSQVLLEGRVAEELSGLAASLDTRYDLSVETAKERSAGIKGFKAQSLTDKRGAARAGNSMKDGRMAIDRYLSYGVRGSQASLAFLLRADAPDESGRYVLLATDDLLEGEPPADSYPPLAKDYGWSDGAIERMRAAPAADFADARQRFEALIAQVAVARS